MNRKVLIGTCGLLALTMIGCTKNETTKKEASTTPSSEIANPFVDCDTIEDAEKETGIDILVPESIDGYSTRVIRALVNEEDNKQNMIEVIYYDDAQEEEIRIRKKAGTQENIDISGDYNEYDITDTKNIDGTMISTRGNEKDVYNVVLFETNDAVYSITATIGINETTLTSLLGQIQ